MLAGMTVAALACLVLAVAPVVIAPALRRVLETLPAAAHIEFTGLGTVVRLPGLQGSISPGVIAAGLALADGSCGHADAVALASAPGAGRLAAMGLRR